MVQTWTSVTSPEYARADQLDRPAQAVRGRALVAHLRADAVLRRLGPHQVGLVHVVRQRLLAVDVLAGSHRQDAGQGVGVVRRADGDGVDVLEQRSVVEESCGSR